MSRYAIALLVTTFSARAALECGSCHGAITTSFAATAHANASRPASDVSILGPFDPKRSTMLTRVPGVYFQMGKRAGGFYQTAFEAGRSHTERFDLVIGSGRRGQSYLYWREGLLFQLPVSYHVGSQRWINSPGYEDSKVNFGRGIPPQCLDCHASRFRLEQLAGRLRYAKDYVLGIAVSVTAKATVTNNSRGRPAWMSARDVIPGWKKRRLLKRTFTATRWAC